MWKELQTCWLNYLRPDIKRGNISSDEEELIIRLHRLLGNRWSLIAGRLPGRTDNEIKNYWNTNLGKKVKNHSTSTLKEQRKMPMIIPSITALQPQPKLEPHVARTKAIRFTKVAFTPNPPDPIEHIETNAMGAPSLNNNIAESKSHDGLSSITPGEDNLPNFMMDLNMGELHPLDLLNSDLLEFFNFENNLLVGDGTNGNGNELSPFSHQSRLFPEDMLMNWTGKDCVQPNMGLDLGSLASFLDSEEA